MLMAGLNRNEVVVGNNIIMTLEIQNQYGDFVDSDAIVTWEVFTPSLSKYASGQGTRESLGVYTANFKIGSSSQPSRDWKIRWNYSIGTPLIFEEYFTVIAFDETTISREVTISQHDLNLIQAELGKPSIDDIELTEEQVKEYCVAPALEMYFSKFPIATIIQYPINGDLTVPFPRDNTFGAKDARIINKFTGTAPTSTGNFFQIWAWNQSGRGGYGSGRPWGRGAYGTGYDFNGSSMLGRMKIMENQTLLNDLGTFKQYIDNENRQIIAYSSIASILEVEWASWSYNFNLVKFVRRNDVIKLASSYLLNQLASLGDMLADDNIPFRIDSDKLRARATVLYTEVSDKWGGFGTAMALR